nr:hypothetical protein [Tanacetum cinerariifolium]
LNSRIFKLEAIIQVLGRERNSDVVQKLEFSDDYSVLNIEFCKELNHAFLELVKSSFIASIGTQSDDDTKEECHETEDFLLEKEFMRLLLDEERLFLEEERQFEKEKRVRLEDQKRLKLEQEHELKVKKRWDEDYRKRSYAFMNSNHMKQAMGCCAPKKRSGSVEICVERPFWESLECLDPTRKGWLLDKVRLPEVLELLNVFYKKGIEKSTYHVTFRIAENIPKQGESLVTVGSGYGNGSAVVYGGEWWLHGGIEGCLNHCILRSSPILPPIPIDLERVCVL